MINNKRSNWLGLLGISIAGFLGCLDLTIVNTALPAIQSELQISVTQLQWVMTILLLALTSFMVVSGKLADLYGRRLCFYIGMGLFAISSLAAGLAPDIHWLVAARFFQGISIAFLYTAPVAMIPSLFPEHEHGRATGLLIGANGLGLAIGPVIGGLMVSVLSWRWIFFINLPLILFSLLFCWKNLTETKNEAAAKKIDWWGFIVLLLSLPMLVLALVQGGAWGWFSAPIISLFLLAIVGVVLFYVIETKVAAPIIDFHLLANRIFLTGLAANFALAFFYAVDFFLIPLYLHYIHDQTGYQIGFTLLPATAMVALLSATAGKIVDKRGPKIVLMTGLILLLISALLQAQFNADSVIYFILFAYLIFGIGWACILSPSIVASLSSVPKEFSGVAMGTLGTLHNLGGAIGLAIGSLIVELCSKSALLLQLKQYNLPSNSWVNEAIANVNNAIEIIQKNTQLDAAETKSIFTHYFLSGYQSAMWLLVIISFIALLAVAVGLKNPRAIKNK